MSRFMNEKYAGLEAYTPGEQPRDQQYIKLNTNESPFPPSPGVLSAVNAAELEKLRLYCDPACTELRAKLAELYGVKPENVYLANGSDDILNFAFMAFGGDGVVYPAISYGFYSVFAALHGVEAEEIPLEADFGIDAEKYCGRNKLVVIANPNAPTGLSISLDDVERLLRRNPDHVVLIDEAYVDFGGESCLPLLKRYDNLLVVQTFSKSRSLAGARLGFAFGSEAVIADLEKIKYSTNPYNVNRLTQIAGIAALEQDEYYKENCRRIMENRRYTADALKALGFTVLDSKANFVFAKSERIDGEALYLELKRRGVLVRHFSREEICQFNRITIGSREEMERFIETVSEILEEIA